MNFALPGKRCEFLTSVSFAQNGSYIEMPSLKTKPEANITMIFSTEEENGILIYNGESQHIAVELFRGRIRVSYDVGNYPVSNMFRFVMNLTFFKFSFQILNSFYSLIRLATKQCPMVDTTRLSCSRRRKTLLYVLIRVTLAL